MHQSELGCVQPDTIRCWLIADSDSLKLEVFPKTVNRTIQRPFGLIAVLENFPIQLITHMR